MICPCYRIPALGNFMIVNTLYSKCWHKPFYVLLLKTNSSDIKLLFDIYMSDSSASRSIHCKH